MTMDIFEHAQAIRDLGGVCTVFTPDEVASVSEDDYSRIEDAMVQAANEVIEQLGTATPNQEDE